jgi:hypothetical protein
MALSKELRHESKCFFAFKFTMQMDALIYIQPKIFQIRRRHTIQIASYIIEDDIFDSPTVLSKNMIGSSFIRASRRHARKFISI